MPLVEFIAGIVVGFFVNLLSTAYYEETGKKIIRPVVHFLKKRRLSLLNPKINLTETIKPSDTSKIPFLNISPEDFKNTLEKGLNAPHITLLKENLTDREKHEYLVRYAQNEICVKVIFSFIPFDESGSVLLDSPPDIVKSTDEILLLKSSEVVQEFLIEVIHVSSYKNFRGAILSLMSLSAEIGSHVASLISQNCVFGFKIEYDRRLLIDLLNAGAKVIELKLGVKTKNKMIVTERTIFVSPPISEGIIALLENFVIEYSR